MSNKIYCCIVSILFWGICFSVHTQDARASDGVRYMSNRVKIVRPEKMVKPPETAVSETPTVEAESEITATADIRKTEPVEPVEKQEGAPTDADQTVEMTEDMIRDEITDLIGKKERFYTRKGRIDPFEPFLRQPEPEVPPETQAKLQRRVPRTPLEKIDLSQLRLTAVLRTPTKTSALVEESSGKGYVVTAGTYIGNKGGQVSQILKDRIMVEEKYLDVFGKISVRERELKLQQ